MNEKNKLNHIEQEKELIKNLKGRYIIWYNFIYFSIIILLSLILYLIVFIGGN